MKVAASTLVASVLVVAAPRGTTQTQQPAQVQLPEDPTTPLFLQMCGKCHDSVRITSTRRTATEWEEMLNKMIEKGATGSGKDFETVYDYLLRNYGKLFINQATPDDIKTILGLSPKDAAAIVTFRNANGAFADFDAVKKVPDIDVKTLEARKDAIAF